MTKSEIIKAHNGNCRDRDEDIRYIILHCSAYPPEKQLEILAQNGLSAHYVIGRDGRVFENCPPEKVAYHAGQSRWLNSEGSSLNGCSIGIEIEAPRLGQTRKDYLTATTRELCVLLTKLMYRFGIKPSSVLGHSDIAPTRKSDPGVGFPWRKLWQMNLAVYPNLHHLVRETDELKLLQTIGYDLANLSAARYAFCRHFMPEEVAIDEDMQHLLDNPYPPEFTPANWDRYIQRLRATVYAFTADRALRSLYQSK